MLGTDSLNRAEDGSHRPMRSIYKCPDMLPRLQFPICHWLNSTGTACQDQTSAAHMIAEGEEREEQSHSYLHVVKVDRNRQHRYTVTLARGA